MTVGEASGFKHGHSQFTSGLSYPKEIAVLLFARIRALERANFEKCKMRDK
jgi:hypothetical protein